MKYVCDVCGWEYDEALGYPEGGIAPGTKWEDLRRFCLPPLLGREGYVLRGLRSSPPKTGCAPTAGFRKRNG